jgi:hypothetical protein
MQRTQDNSRVDRVFDEFVWAPLSDSAPRVAPRSLAVLQLVFNKISAVREFEAAPVGG